MIRFLEKESWFPFVVRKSSPEPDQSISTPGWYAQVRRAETDDESLDPFQPAGNFPGISETWYDVFRRTGGPLRLFSGRIHRPPKIAQRKILRRFGGPLPVPFGTANSQVGTGLGVSQAAPLGGLTAWLGGLICLASIFFPSFLLIPGALPFREVLREQAAMRSALPGGQCGRRRSLAGRALPARLDTRHSFLIGFHLGDGVV
jgi:hypothetical protein